MSSSTPLTTIEEQEDRRILEKAQHQVRKESLSKGEKEKEIDVGRTTTTLTPSEENVEQVLPNVTVHYNKESGGQYHHGNDEDITIAEEMGQMFPDTEIVSSPTKEISLGGEEKAMPRQAKVV